jgi:hypothetical protein
MLKPGTEGLWACSVNFCVLGPQNTFQVWCYTGNMCVIEVFVVRILRFCQHRSCEAIMDTPRMCVAWGWTQTYVFIIVRNMNYSYISVLVLIIGYLALCLA